jgi:hypothetical protein
MTKPHCKQQIKPVWELNFFRIADYRQSRTARPKVPLTAANFDEEHHDQRPNYFIVVVLT